MDTTEVIEGRSGKEYTAKERNTLVYDTFREIRDLKEEESFARKQITAKINFIEKELHMGKDTYKAWVALKMAELTKSDTSKTEAVELDYELKVTREKYGSSETEEKIERNCDYEDNSETEYVD